MTFRISSPCTAFRLGRCILAATVLVAFCAACTSIPDLWRPPKPRAAAPAPSRPAPARELFCHGTTLVMVQVDAKAAGELAVYDAGRIGKEPFPGLLRAGGWAGPVWRETNAETTVGRSEIHATARLARFDAVWHA